MDTGLRRSGIYAIRHTDTERVYVGSAVILGKRWGQHQRSLRSGKHHSAKLQHAWDKYGSDAFSFSVIEFVDDPSRLLEREQFWIDSTNASTSGFNISVTAGSLLGFKHTSSARQKMSDAHVGRERSAEHRTNLSKVNLGKKMSDAARQKMRLAKLGTKRAPHSLDTRAKMSAAQTGRCPSAETRAKLAAAKRGKKHSPEIVAKRAESIRKAMRADGYVNPAIGRKLKPESIAKREATRKANRELRAT